ncbi:MULTISPECIES: catalase [unclassified Rhizobacter]|uniref:catalase n=1 Tax=unclassified Rhizobacter TaxID=2640088 RepID=UPI0006F437C3|nr:MULTISPECIES: catalase [unclassified Rhizobacter]KQU78322.1 catalase [Rhizobacter sp. Root29]KQW16068.1 catalase [Rhizobacter sp. Root1238]KRB25187.1 catalase [Rhizobacter sp. Root16D2]
MSQDTSRLTTASGIAVEDNQNSITAGPRGPVLLQDFHLIEKLQHFNRERIPERVVHAKGSGAYGTFTVTHDISRYTKARLFSAIGKQTETFVRFSTVGGEKGSADTERDPRGFALRFYTEDGNWDLVGNNTPMFFIKDAIKFPDFIHTQKRDPQTNLKSATMMWDFWSKAPESLHQVTMLFSDRGTPDGYRHMDGFGSHTFSLINAGGERVWVKWHLKTQQGIRNLLPEDAARLAGTDPDHAQRDLFGAIASGDFPKWNVFIQVMTEAEAVAWEARTGWNPFDLTKVWPHKDFPRIPVGVLELNRNPVNYHAEVEQAALSPANVVPGLGFSPDKMLQGRLFAYHDAQLYRVGTNHQHLPVNRPRCPVNHQQRDGSMAGTAGDTNGSSAAQNYAPVQAGGVAPTGFGHGDAGWALNGTAGRYDERGQSDDFTQAGNLFRLLPADEKERLTSNIANAMRGVPSDEIRQRQIEHFTKADPAYGAAVARKLAEGGAR